jgi:hypothetical protein
MRMVLSLPINRNSGLPALYLFTECAATFDSRIFLSRIIVVDIISKKTKRKSGALTNGCGFVMIVGDRMKGEPCGGDWCLVVPLVFKTSVGRRPSRVGSIPIRLRHLRFVGQATVMTVHGPLWMLT